MQVEKERRMQEGSFAYNLENKRFQEHLLYKYMCLCSAELYLRDLQKSYDFYHLANTILSENGEVVDLENLVEEQLLYVMIQDTKYQISRIQEYLKSVDEERYQNCYEQVFNNPVVLCREVDVVSKYAIMRPDFLLTLGDEFAQMVGSFPSIDEAIHFFNMDYYGDIEQFHKRNKIINDLISRWEENENLTFFIETALAKAVMFDTHNDDE